VKPTIVNIIYFSKSQLTDVVGR